MHIRPIRNDQDHRAALAEIDACWGALEGTEKGDKLEVLVALVESYEARRWPIESDKRFDPTPTRKEHAVREVTQPGLGGAVRYRTTPLFERVFGLESLSALPRLDDLGGEPEEIRARLQAVAESRPA